jgi:hypothetical protein
MITFERQIVNFEPKWLVKLNDKEFGRLTADHINDCINDRYLESVEGVRLKDEYLLVLKELMGDPNFDEELTQKFDELINTIKESMQKQ